MSFATIPSPLNPIRDALSRYKSEREKNAAEIDRLTKERAAIRALLPELRKERAGRVARVDRLHDEVNVYAYAIDDLERQFRGVAGWRAELLDDCPVLDAPDGVEVDRLRAGDACRVVAGGRFGYAQLAWPVPGFVDEAALPEAPPDAFDPASDDDDDDDDDDGYDDDAYSDERDASAADDASEDPGEDPSV